MQTRRYKALLGILIAVTLSSTALSGVVFATPQQAGTPLPPGGQGPRRGVNPETGKVSFIGGGDPIRVPGISAVNGITPENRAMGFAKIYGGEFGLRSPAQELKLLEARKDINGNDLVRYQQTYLGVPVIAGEMIVNMHPGGDLLSVSGEVSSNLRFDTQPAIPAQEAQRIALMEIANLHQTDPAQLDASHPELWIFDESLLTASPRPAELVWRLEVKAREALQPIREMVLVNAQRGGVSFHINMVDSGIAADKRLNNLATIPCTINMGAGSGGMFLPYKQYNCGVIASGVGVGDFNHDGKQDVAIVGESSPTLPSELLVFTQEVSGNLSQPRVYPGGNDSETLVAGDINNDGRDDVITADFDDNQISVFLQEAGGALAPRLTYPTDTGPDALAIGDVNNDGLNDIVVTHWTAPSMGVFIQNDRGSLNPMLTYAAPETGRNDVAIGDVNHDRLNDVVRMNGSGAVPALLVYLQTSGNTLAPYVPYSLPDCASHCTGYGIGIGDVTVDGRTDVVMSYGGNVPTSKIVVFPQGSDGTLQTAISSASFHVPQPVEIGDVNSDSLMDVITLHGGWKNAGVSTGQQNGTLGLEDLYPIPYRSHYGRQDLSLGDVNNDGFPDVLIADETGLVVLLRNPILPPTSTPIVTSTPGPGPSRTPGPTSTAGPSPTAVPLSATGSRRTHTASGSATLPGTFLCDENQPACTAGADPDADNAHRYAADTFVFYNTRHGRNSFDSQGGTLVSTVHFGVGYQNAFWDGYQVVYGDGMAADDVVAHEITHGVTQYASNLIYAYQSGAINESFSDIWGEFIDQTNGSGTDDASVKWLIGEDAAQGALRNMSDPTRFGDPDRMGSPFYYHGPADNGGVHFNSGVNNKAAFLMTEGGTFNGRTITGIGMDKTAAVYYEAQVNLLTAGSNYNDLYYALVQACRNLLGGPSGLTRGDCSQVQAAAEAVEMATLPPPAPTPTATPPYSYQPLYLSLTSSQTVGGVSASDEDILRFDGASWSLFFDGSDVGVGSPDLFAFSFLDTDTLLMSFASDVTVNGVTAAPQDILRFDATSLGSTTAGTFSLYFDGGDVGLDNSSGEKIDALSLLPDGRLLISTNGNPSVPDVAGKDEDVLGFLPTSLGDTTSGTWSLFFDGSDVGLSETSGEDVDALDVVGGNIYFSTQDVFDVNGLSGADEDIFVCTVTSLGEATACDYQTSLYFDGSTWGLEANDVDAFHVLASASAPTAVPSTTIIAPPTGTPTGTAAPTNTPTSTATPTATSTGGGTFTIAPAADAYVNAGSPTSNYGSATALRADASPDLHSYLRFDVQGLSGTVTKATLRVYANSSSSLGCLAHRVDDNTWDEAALNYNNAPAVGNALGASGAFGAGAWVEIDVTGYIAGDGTYSLALTTTSSTALSLASRESANVPQLIIETMP